MTVICIWPDGDWCEWSEFDFMVTQGGKSDDAVVVSLHDSVTPEYVDAHINELMESARVRVTPDRDPNGRGQDSPSSGCAGARCSRIEPDQGSNHV